MASYHQHWMCYHQLGVMGQKKSKLSLQRPYIYTYRDIFSVNPDEQFSTGSFYKRADIWTAKDVAYHGCTYKSRLVVAGGNNFLCIDFILFQGKIIYLLVKTSICSIFVNNLNAFEVESTD